MREQTDLRLGIEADFIPGAEDRIANLLDGHGFDYVVGSVHFLRDHASDMEDYSVWGSGRSAEEIWRAYFLSLGEAARSGLFDILAHPDLVKVWGRDKPLPEGDLRRYYELAMDGIAESGIAIEVSTAGLRKASPGDLSRAGVLGDVPRSRRASGALERRPPAAGRRRRLRAGLGVARSGGRRASCACSTVASAAWRRSPPPVQAGRSAGCPAAGRQPAAPRRWADRGVGGMTALSGIGYDSHRLAAARKLILGGVEIPGDIGLEGHSDADVLTHAVIDALLGAAGLGDIGEHFPDSDELYRDADSLELLSAVVTRVIAQGLGARQRRRHGRHGAPQAGPAQARRSASRSPSHSGLPIQRVNVKASTGEGIGFVGRGEGVAALAVVSLRIAD